MGRISDTRAQIMDRAGHLLMSRGFNGFSYRDISSFLGIKNAAVHYHFRSKADLALAAMAAIAVRRALFPIDALRATVAAAPKGAERMIEVVAAGAGLASGGDSP